MLLLSSATRILTTERPPTILFPLVTLAARPCRITYTNVLEHPLDGASISTARVCVGTEYYALGPANRLSELKSPRRPAPLGYAPRCFSSCSPRPSISPGDAFSQAL